MTQKIVYKHIKDTTIFYIFEKKKTILIQQNQGIKTYEYFSKTKKRIHGSLITSFLLDKSKETEEHILNKLQGTSKKINERNHRKAFTVYVYIFFY